ncbi:Transcription factor [Aspergillus sclerotialis]|uniref:Transcription factor n=1 Tax=Aspergillus sclerotialis TaxID=2070753 RepID=A0A3A2ZI84_9EURO|nr:Transcription factor [Aspergillus sclerotialis]
MKIIDPRSFLCLTAIADRIAKRDGLHCNTQGRGLSAFDTEIRRRIWWQTVLLDSRAVEMSGAGTPILSYAWNAKLPLNINESELSPEANSLPQEHDCATDMIFCLVRCEIAKFLRQIRAKKGLEEGWTEFSNPSISVSEKLEAIDTFEEHLQAR